MTAMKKSELVGLRGMIADLAARGRAIGVQIQQAFDRARYDLWNDKRALGSEARMALLAFAFLRDVPYRVVEPTADLSTVHGNAKGLAIAVAKVANVTNYEPIWAWLVVPESAERKAKRETATRDGYARGRVRREAAALRHAVRGAA